jgi:hypothetical protein
VVVHSGQSTHVGHYYCYGHYAPGTAPGSEQPGREQRGARYGARYGAWRLYNDARVYTATERSVLDAEAFVLCYELCETGDGDRAVKPEEEEEEEEEGIEVWPRELETTLSSGGLGRRVTAALETALSFGGLGRRVTAALETALSFGGLGRRVTAGDWGYRLIIGALVAAIAALVARKVLGLTSLSDADALIIAGLEAVRSAASRGAPPAPAAPAPEL